MGLDGSWVITPFPHRIGMSRQLVWIALIGRQSRKGTEAR